MTRFLRAQALACVLLALAIVPARASAFTTALVDLAQPYVADIFALLAAALATWLVRQVNRFLGISLDEKYRAGLETALINAAGLLVAKAGSAAAAARLPMGSAAFDQAMAAATRGAGDAIAHFGLSPGVVAEKLVAKVGVLAASPAAPR